MTMNSFERKITPAFILKFTLPTMIMMVFNSFYTMVDGGFVSNFVGTAALSAINIVYPVISLVFSVGIMLATGGSAVVAKQMGEGNEGQAKKSFSLITLLGVSIGALFMLVGTCFTKPIVMALGANEAIYSFCYDYTFFISLFVPFAVLQVLFQFFFATSGRPDLGLISTVIGGVSNIVLDYVFMVPLNMGIKGAAIATGIGFVIPSVIGIMYFTGKSNRILHFVKPVFDGSTVLKTCTNGSSEMVSNLSVAITTFMFNIIMMRYLGEDGVAAMTIVFYAQFLLTAVFMGYTSGVAPLISFNYGAQNKNRLKQLFKISMIFIAFCSALAFILSILLAKSVVGVFAPPGSNVFDLAIQGMGLFAIGFLFMGFNIFASGMFTALSNGKVSAILSFLRTFVFIVIAISVLPVLFEIDGIWVSVPIAEFLAILVSAWYMVKLKKVYEY